MYTDVKISDEQANMILSKKESFFIDFKSKRLSPASMSKTVSGLANSVGGDIYIGIEENKDQFTWDGFESIEDANAHVALLVTLYLLDNYYNVTFFRCDNKVGYVMYLQVYKTKNIIKSTKGDIYVRKSAQNLKLISDEEINRLKLDKGIVSFESELLNIPKTAVTDSLTIYKFMYEVIPTTEPEAWLKKQLLIDNDKPNVCSVILFSDAPQAALPKQSGIKIYRYLTSDNKGSRDTLGFLPITVEGCAYDLIYEAVKKTKEIIESEKLLKESGLEDLKYPEKALHEIITNAVLHRDYSLAADIRIRIFDNRIEIESPGKLAGHVTVENILETQAARNGNLVRLINKFPNPPNQDVGEGLATAFNEIADLRLKTPTIQELDSAVLVIIKHEKLASPEKLILEHLLNNDEINNEIARDITSLPSRDNVTKIFQKLKQRKLIKLSPDTAKRGRKTAYVKGELYTSNIEKLDN
jgi:ATP-dependent DNA helicase RecG